MKSFIKWLIALASSFIILFTSLGYYASSQVLFFKLRDVEVIKRRETRAKRLNMKAFQNLPQDDILIPSKFDYSINAVFVHPNDTNKWMVLCHGVTENKISSIKYLNMFTDMGYNCVIYDARRHGNTGGVHSTYGFYEKYDLETVVDYLFDHYGPDVEVGIHGESMGAATMLLYAGELSNRARFYISDASFSTFGDELTNIFSQYTKIGSPLILIFTNIFFRLRSRFSLFKVSPIRVVEKIDQPVLFVHSKPDKFIPYTHTEELYKKKKPPKAAWYPERGGHVESYNKNPEKYRRVVESFIANHVGW
ncbi:alpha/beta hydrolase [Salinicoccus roseus]|uniref:alpha/beta hydrolase n=1 Tax=Salinicoccus roseus TaxID=45670 RepID=UPI0023000238|nr:alpha/beta hydrolase [Salinicoccus roseus]